MVVVQVRKKRRQGEFPNKTCMVHTLLLNYKQTRQIQGLQKPVTEAQGELGLLPSTGVYIVRILGAYIGPGYAESEVTSNKRT